MSVADAMTGLWAWTVGLAAVQPLIIRRYNGMAKLYFEPAWSPFVHPWRVTVDQGTGKADVAGGLVYAGGTPQTVTALTGETLAASWKCVLKVKHYYNLSTPSEYGLQTTTGAWPADEHTSAHWLSYLRVAEMDDGALVQYLYEDQVVPRVPPPLTDTTNAYFLMVIGGTMQWTLSGDCEA